MAVQLGGVLLKEMVESDDATVERMVNGNARVGG